MKRAKTINVCIPCAFRSNKRFNNTGIIFTSVDFNNDIEEMAKKTHKKILKNKWMGYGSYIYSNVWGKEWNKKGCDIVLTSLPATLSKNKKLLFDNNMEVTSVSTYNRYQTCPFYISCYSDSENIYIAFNIKTDDIDINKFKKQLDTLK